MMLHLLTLPIIESPIIESNDIAIVELSAFPWISSRELPYGLRIYLDLRFIAPILMILMDNHEILLRSCLQVTKDELTRL